MSILQDDTRGRVALIALFSAYMVWWILGNSAMLFDPMLQNNDARTHVYIFYKYAGNKAISTDPIASDLFNMSPLGIRALYRVLVPVAGVTTTAKIVQDLCFLIIFISFFLIVRRRRENLPVAIIFLFFVLHTTGLIENTAGGLQRNFGVPIMALWCAGAYTENRLVRYAAIFIGALTYPVIMALMINVEFFLIALSLILKNKASLRTEFWKEFKLFTLLFIACIILLSPYMIMKSNAGPVYSLKQARQEPAFGPSGRVPVLPFPNPLKRIWKYSKTTFAPSGHKVISHTGIYALVKRKEVIIFFIVCISVVVAIFVHRKIVPLQVPIPKVAVCLIIASIWMYSLSRIFAFQLYHPDRYLEYGLAFAGISIITEIVPYVRIKFFSVSSSWISFVVVVITLIFLGDGVVNRLGTDLDGRIDHNLYEYFKRTSFDTRILCHPYDGDDIPLWAGRPTTGGYESLQPWFVEPWQRDKSYIKEVLGVLYAKDWGTISSFCQKYRITHLLLRSDRYGPDFRERAIMYEPFGSYIKNLLESVNQDELVLEKVIKRKASFKEGPFVVIRVKDIFP